MQNKHNVAENVLSLVNMFPVTKENYNTLLYYYWTIFDGATSLTSVSNLTPAESVTRAYRKLIESGFIDSPRQKKEEKKEYKSEFTSLV